MASQSQGTISLSEEEYNTDDEKRAVQSKKSSQSKSQVHRKQKYKSEWEALEIFKCWLTRDNSNVYNAKCTACSVALTAEKNVLIKSLRHVRNMAGKARIIFICFFLYAHYINIF